jgi:hypothetical protein
MASGGSKSLCGEEIRNILVEYEGQISSDSEIDGEFDTSDSGSSHVDDIALGEAIVKLTSRQKKKELKVFGGKICSIMTKKGSFL